LLCGCSIKQQVRPVALGGQTHMSIVRNPAVRATFLEATRRALTDKGLEVEVVENETDVTPDDFALTYLAHWNWDVSLYMWYCEFKVYRNGRLEGQAMYDSGGGDANPAKFINAEEKVRRLIDLLFPDAPKGKE
jgi:hypothetical protein